VNGAAAVNQKVALTLRWFSKPEQLAITDYVFGFKFGGSQPEKGGGAAQIVFR
jgi:hypothetical protein